MHCARARSGVVDHVALVTLHRALVAIAPTLGARVALGASVARDEGPAAGLASLETIDDPALARFQPAWATRAALLAESGDIAAVPAYEKAISLTTDFFFSSRRRHTRWTGDWSSDVCSSD